MRLYLSSFGLGDHPEELLTLLRGGRRAAVVLNAKDGSSAEGRAASLEHEMKALASLGLEPSELDLRSFFGQPERLKERLAEVDLLWIRGGNTFVLRRAFLQSGADEILLALLENDAIVYGGFSAGIAILAPSLRGLDLVDDPVTVPAGYDDSLVWNGLNVLPYALVPHYRSDHPESAAVERLVEYLMSRHVEFKTLRDGEALVVDGESDARIV